MQVTVTEAHVLRMLRLSGYDEQEALALVRRLTFPADIDDVAALFGRLGIDTDSLVDRMGGSP